MARITVADQLAKVRKQVLELQAKEKALLSRANDKVISQIVTLAKKHGVSAQEIVEALGKTKAKTATKVKSTRVAKKAPSERAKVAPVYRNPANPEQTWSKRGKIPRWCLEMKEAGTLETALIVAE